MAKAKRLEKTLRKFTVDKLEALQTLLNLQETVYTTTTISGALDLKDKDLGARISSFTRSTIDGEPMLVSVGKSEDGVLWRFNDKVASKDIFKELVDGILEQNKEYRLKTEG